MPSSNLRPPPATKKSMKPFSAESDQTSASKIAIVISKPCGAWKRNWFKRGWGILNAQHASHVSQLQFWESLEGQQQVRNASCNVFTFNPALTLKCSHQIPQSADCPESHPYPYRNGEYCCAYDQEHYVPTQLWRQPALRRDATTPGLKVLQGSCLSQVPTGWVQLQEWSR